MQPALCAQDRYRGAESPWFQAIFGDVCQSKLGSSNCRRIDCPEEDRQMDTKLLIDGKLVAGEAESETILNPATGEAILKLPAASRDQINQAVAAATRAFPKWAATTPGSRSTMLLKLADKLEEQQEEFARLESRN